MAMEEGTDNFNAPPPLSFDGNVTDNWKLWKQQFFIFLRATNSVESDDKRKVAMFLNHVGLEGLLLFNTFSLDSETATLDQVVAAFESHCIPSSTNNVILERFNFFKTRRRDGQTFDQYLAEMKNAAARCEFAEADNIVRDQIIFQLENETLRDRLLRIPNLNLEKTVEHCRMVESWAHTWSSWLAHSPGTSDPSGKSYDNGLHGHLHSPARSVITRAPADPSDIVSAVLEDLNGGNRDDYSSSTIEPVSTFARNKDASSSDTDSSVLSLSTDWNDAAEILEREGELDRDLRRKISKVDRLKKQLLARVEPRVLSSSDSSSNDSDSDSDIEELPPPPRPPPIVITIDEDTSESEDSEAVHSNKKLKTESKGE